MPVIAVKQGGGHETNNRRKWRAEEVKKEKEISYHGMYVSHKQEISYMGM
jgi:hypothetical protein